MLTLLIHCRKIVSKTEQIRKPPEFYNIYHLTTFICQYCELFFLYKVQLWRKICIESQRCRNVYNFCLANDDIIFFSVQIE